VPEAVIYALGLPADCFDKVAAIWHAAVRQAVSTTIEQARSLQA
jgi:hypothetical protein